MDLQILSHVATYLRGTEPASVESLLKRCYAYIQRGQYAEGIALLDLVHTFLITDLPMHVHLIHHIETFMRGYTDYQRVEQSLQEASTRFAQAQKEQLARAETFGNIVSTWLSTVPSLEQRDDAVEREALLCSPSSPVAFLASPDAQSNSQLTITCFGHFEVRYAGKLVALCPSRNGQAILRYLVAQMDHRATSDILQTLFWPEDEQEVAQRKLHIAISALRRSLNRGMLGKNGDSILFKNRIYSLNPALTIRTDVDELLHYYQAGQQENEQSKQKVAFYEDACQLYTGPFLTEDLYADWSLWQRERLSRSYLTMCRFLANHYVTSRQYEHAIKWAIAILEEDHCDELTHCQLIQIYGTQGRRNEALQQYWRCERILRDELGVKPLPETVQVFEKLFTNSADRDALQRK